MSAAQSQPSPVVTPDAAAPTPSELQGKRVGMVVFSHYEFDPRPRRAAEALANAGMHVDLICLRENDSDPKCAVVKGVNLRRVPIAKRREGVLGYLYQYSAF